MNKYYSKKRRNLTWLRGFFLIVCMMVGHAAWGQFTATFVDLGLPSGTKWATCNLGATIPYDYGNYYFWGTTSPSTSSCSSFEGDIAGNATYDAATANLGSGWQIPTKEQIAELTHIAAFNYVTPCFSGGGFF